MAKERSATVTLRVPGTVRELLRAAAEKDHRSMANMLEVLILRYCENNGISIPIEREIAPPRRTKGHRATRQT